MLADPAENKETIDYLMKGCSCKTGCQSQRCGCRKNNHNCGPGCQRHNCTNLPVINAQELEAASQDSSESSESEPENDMDVITILKMTIDFIIITNLLL